MIKRTIYIGKPAFLCIEQSQLKIYSPDRKEEKGTCPVEDIGIVLLDHPQITVTHAVFQQLMENNTALLSCDQQHLPNGLCLPMNKHTTQSEHYRKQIDATPALKGNLWKQTVEMKIKNQAAVLRLFGLPSKRLDKLVHKIKSDDKTNIEAQAAAIYWNLMFEDFTRERYGEPPNHLLNYGYAILRAMVARAIVSSGMLPTLGIFHRNKYNAFCLADDIMEPMRPMVDRMVKEYLIYHNPSMILEKEDKAYLLQLPTIDVLIKKRRSPLMAALPVLTASLYQCYEGSRRKLIFPNLNP